MKAMSPQLREDTVTHESITYKKNYFCENAVVSGVSDPAYTVWTSQEAVTKDQIRLVPELSRLYKCAAANSSGEFPSAYKTVWQDRGAINSQKMFDDQVGTQTESTTDFSVEFDFNMSDTIAVINIENIVDITVTQYDRSRDINDPEYVVFSEEYSMREFGVDNLYDYFTLEPSWISTFKKLDMQWLPSSSVKLEFTVAGTGKVGSLVAGLLQDLGVSVWGFSADLQDKSVYVMDEFGYTTFEKRPVLDVIEGSVTIETGYVGRARKIMKALAGRMTLFVFDERDNGFEFTTLLGYAPNPKFPIDSPVEVITKYKMIGVV